jgi:hypothetical protein
MVAVRAIGWVYIAIALLAFIMGVAEEQVGLAAAGVAAAVAELRVMVLSAFPDIDAGQLAQVLGLGLVAAHAGGRAAIIEEDR